VKQRFEPLAEKVRMNRTHARSHQVQETVSVLLIDAGLIIIIALITPFIFERQTLLFDVNAFASLTLMVIGLMTMIRTKDVVSQIMGLAVAFNGLYAIGYTFLSPAAPLSIDPQLQILLFLCLISGTTLSYAIGYFLVPAVVESSGSIDMEKQDVLNEKMPRKERRRRRRLADG
jgi:hypothetical protein